MPDEFQMRETKFAPMLYLKNVADAIEFYEKAFDAKELRRWSNDDGSVHVAEMSIEDALFHLHEEVDRNSEMSPIALTGTSVELGLFVTDPDAVAAKAIAAGAKEISPMQDYDFMDTGREALPTHLGIIGQFRKKLDETEAMLNL